MSNASSLIATDQPDPTIDKRGRRCYSVEQVLADGPCAVPIFWVALFDRENLVEVEVTDEEGDEFLVPSLVAEAAAAGDLLAARGEAILAAFPEFVPTRDSFARLLGRSKRRYLKVDLEEIWGLDPEGLGVQLDAGFRWFATQDAEDFDQLLALASIADYDPQGRTFSAQEGVPRAFHFRGYASRDVDWDNEADI